MRELFQKKNIHLFLLACIVVLGCILRFSNIPARYGFDADPTRDSLITYYGSHGWHFPLIGPNSGIGAFNFGPWYYYQLIIFSLIFPFMYAPWIYIGMLSLLCIVVMYQIGNLLRGKTLGLILAFLLAISPAEVGPTSGLSNPNLIPIHACLMLFIFFKYIKSKPSLRWAFLWGLILGIGINNHFQLLLLSFLPPLVFIIKREQLVKRMLLFLLGLSISFIPLLIFNIQYHWYTLRGFSTFVQGGQAFLYVPNSWRIYLFSFWPTFWAYVTGTTLPFGLFLGAFVLCVFSYLLVKRKLSDFYLFLLSFIIIFITLRYYSGERHNYYLLFLHPFLFIMVGFSLFSLLSAKGGKIIVSIMLITIFLTALPEDIKRLQTREDYVITKSASQHIATLFPNETFQIYTCRNEKKNITQGIVFHLVHEGKITDTGRKIGLENPNCEKPLSTEVKKDTILDFSKVNEKFLASSGWKLVSPKTVYEETVAWWK